MGHACGDETTAPPDDDSPQAAYCDFWTHPDDRVTLALGLLFYAPAVAPLLGGIVAARTGRHVAYSIATVASLLVVAAWTTLAAALTG